MSELPVASATPPPGRKKALWLASAAVVVVTTLGLAASRVFLGSPFTHVPEPDLAEEARLDLQRRSYRPLSEPLAALLNDPAYKPIPTQAHPLLGLPAPDFTLQDTEARLWGLAEHVPDGPIVLVFYYGYHCNHCVSQLFALNKDIDKLNELGAKVVAVSADAPELTRERFKKYGAFAFPVLSDPGNAVATKYGTFAPNPKPGEDGDLLHGTFVIDRSGKVVWVNRGDGPFTENRTLLLEARRCQRTPPAP